MVKMPAVFVDRDDTLVADVPYCSDPEKVRLLPNVADGLRLMAENGYSIVVITNQSGIGRGYFDESQLRAVNARLRERLRSRGVDFRALYYCPHRPAEGCACRKPRPGLILRAADELDLDLKSSFVIGDREADVEAGRTAGTSTILVPRKGHPYKESRADYIANSLVDAARFVVTQKTKGRREGRKS